MVDASGGSRLFHLCDGASAIAGYHRVPTTPSFQEAASGLTFRYCSLVVSPVDGTVFIQSFGQLWKVTPS